MLELVMVAVVVLVLWLLVGGSFSVCWWRRDGADAAGSPAQAYTL
jgi:hypothetical protein